jgi:hypothetical protein
MVFFDFRSIKKRLELPIFMVGLGAKQNVLGPNQRKQANGVQQGEITHQNAVQFAKMGIKSLRGGGSTAPVLLQTEVFGMQR